MIFKLIKEIKSKAGVIHFKRWLIFKIPFTTLQLFLHQINKADEDKDEHDHPWNFISLIISGGYVETSEHLITRRKPGSICFRKAATSHKITQLFGKTYSLVLVWGDRRPWGYNTEGGWVESQQYRNIKNGN